MAQRQVTTFEAGTAVNIKAGELTPSGGDYVVTPSGSVPTSALDPDGTLAANSDSKVATQKATKTYADTKQPLDATLTALAGLTTAADKAIIATASDTFSTFTFSSAWRTVVGFASVAAASIVELGGSALTATYVPIANGSGKLIDSAMTWASNALTLTATECAEYINSTTTTLGAYLILRSNGNNVGSFQAGGTAMTDLALRDQMRIRAYRAAGGIDFSVAGNAHASVKFDHQGNTGFGMAAPAANAAPTMNTYGGHEFYYAAGSGGVKAGIAAIDTTTQAAGQGGGILFGGAYTGTTLTSAALIRALKTNGTAGDFGFGIGVYVRPNGGGLTLAATYKSDSILNLATGLEVADLTVGEGVQATTSGRLARTRRLQIYATGTTNGTAGTSVSLTAAALATSGDLRWIKLTVKAKGANVPPAKFARTLECFWGNAAGTLSQTGSDVTGTLFSSGALAGGTIVSAASGTNVVITCTDVTGVGATVTWELFGEYC